MTGTERLAELDRGENPSLILRMASGFAVMGDSQFLPGYCLLLAYPEANHLTDLEVEARSRYLLDMSLLGEAVLQVTNCRRINYGIYGNLDPFLHAHIWARYETEQEPLKFAPYFTYSAELREAPEHRFDPAKHGDLQGKIREALLKLVSQ